MTITSGKSTVLKSTAGTVPSLEVTLTGMTANGVIVLTLAERDSATDRRGQMEFYAIPGVDKFTIYGESKELFTDTDIFWMAEANGQTSSTPQVLTGAGAIDLIADVTNLVTTAADALTLADGSEGQKKVITMKTYGGDGTLTPTSLGNGTTITFDDVGDCANLIFTDGSWYMIGGTATLA